jgi:DNA-binding CsgD family transcriptional regulator
MIVRAPASTELIARDEELQALIALRRSAAQGHGALVLVEGEAGIGKTRLLAAFRDTMRNGRTLVGVGRCREFGNVPYGAVHEALRAAGSAPLRVAARDRAEYLAALHAELEALAERRPTVLMLEDVHWGDESGLEFLAHALPAIGRTRVLIVVTYRSDQLEESNAMPFIARFGRDASCHRIVMTALLPSETRRLVGAAAGDDGRLDRLEVDRIVERSEGNPFFAEELVREALRAPDASGRRALPLTIRGIIEERLRALDEPGRRIIELAAVIGRTFDAGFLQRIAGVPPENVLHTLRRSRDVRLIEETAPGSSQYAFRHALTREAIYDSMLALETRPLHATILRALEAGGGASVQDLGYHAWAARDAPACTAYNERAGDAAAAVYAHAEAVRFFERALLGANDDAAATRLLAKAALSCARDGDARRATSLYEAAAQACERSGGIAAAVEHYEAMSRQARVSGDNAKAVSYLERALRMVPPGEARLRARAALSLAFLHLDRGDAAEAAKLLREFGDEHDAPNYYNVVSYMGIVRGDLALHRDGAAGYIERAASIGSDRVLSARFNEAFGLSVLGCDREALEKLDTLVVPLEEQRLHSLQVLAYANAALIHVRQARFDAASAAIERGLAVPEPATTGPVALASAAASLAVATRDARLVERAVSPALIEAALCSGINSTLGRFAGPYARWLSIRGHDEAAADLLRRAMLAISAPFAATDTLLAAVTLGDSWTRRRAFEFLPALDAMAELPIYAATAAELRALASRFAGERGALEHGMTAAALYRELGWPLREAAALDIAGEPNEAARIRRATGGAPHADRSSAADAPGALLSAREREIAALIARGISNAGIAERFSVNRRTVEKHLTAIYEKLGVRNRSELAAFVAGASAGTVASEASSPASAGSGRAITSGSI